MGIFSPSLALLDIALFRAALSTESHDDMNPKLKSPETIIVGKGLSGFSMDSTQALISSKHYWNLEDGHDGGLYTVTTAVSREGISEHCSSQ